MRRRRRIRFRRSSLRAQRNPLDALIERRSQALPGVATPLESITPPSPTASASERTGSHISIRLTLVAVIVAGLFSVLVVRLWSLQVISGESASDLAQALTTRDIDLQPPRGDIVAIDGQVLAHDVALEQVTLSKNALEQNPFVEGTLAALLNVSAKTIQQAFDDDQYSPLTPIPVPTGPQGVTAADVQYIEHHGAEFPGVSVSNGYERDYPDGDLGSQVLGYVGQITPTELPEYQKYGYTAEDQIGQTGLESEYELQLHGAPGVQKVEVDPYGNIVSTVSTTPPRRGDALVLNMDAGLEKEVSSALSSWIQTVRAGLPGNGGLTPAPWASALVMDADTGAVNAMVSYPYFNDNDWTGGISEQQYEQLLNAPGQPLNNYAIASLEPPGSTFKLATATAALNDGLISANTYIDDPGSFTLGDKTYYDTAESRGAGELNVSQAITQSNDIFFYQLGAWFWDDQKKYGQDAIQNVAMDYGLGTTTGIDLPGAVTGQIDSPKLRRQQHALNPQAFPNNTYFPGDNVEMAFGQGETEVDPIQLAQAYATFANGGTRYAPELANEIVDTNGKVVQKIQPKVLGHVALPPSTYGPMLAGFEGVTQNPQGTAYSAFSGFDFSKWDVAGKTGTATVSENDTIAPTAWFVGFGGPRDDKDRYVVVVEVDQGGYGAEAAAPVARQIFNYLVQHPVPKHAVNP